MVGWLGGRIRMHRAPHGLQACGARGLRSRAPEGEMLRALPPAACTVLLGRLWSLEHRVISCVDAQPILCLGLFDPRHSRYLVRQASPKTMRLFVQGLVMPTTVRTYCRKKRRSKPIFLVGGAPPGWPSMLPRRRHPRSTRWMAEAGGQECVRMHVSGRRPPTQADYTLARVRGSPRAH